MIAGHLKPGIADGFAAHQKREIGHRIAFCVNHLPCQAADINRFQDDLESA